MMRDFATYEAQDAEHLQFVGNLVGKITPELTGRAADLSSQLKPLHAIKPVLQSRYLVKGWLDRGTASVVYGESNVGKTFFALDLSMHIAAAKNWHDCRVPHDEDYAGPVVYVAGEGGRGLNNRIEAIRRERPDLMEHTEEDGDFLLLPTALNLCNSGDATALTRALSSLSKSPSLIVIDTLARSMGDGDENTAKDMGAFVRNIDHLRNETGAHVMVIHHSGKDTSKGARGSGSLRAAVDTEIELTRSGDVVMAETRKQRDMICEKVFAYKLRDVFIGYDEDGDAVTSAVVEPTDPVKHEPKISGQAEVALQALGDAIRKHGEKKQGDDYPNVPCVLLSQWRDSCDLHGLADSDDRDSMKRAFNRNKTALQSKNLIRIYNNFVWMVPNENQ
ncbi:helicase RepA family protein [Pseudohalocynthiibacter sp. F2068]|jgi:AAA domain|uniref:helicase RepA family protein n=1 Tax=Pseudohalocynthiibacter sp. F2068 TaxID=2926418 RepID=UPI001FF31580|nr:helicase RepA family protein [Pseudohalocynthiibacter sp. F2068]MCK0102536.1 helicase RepA family protein [Pseudohalocynthiibacter sp. F2068]